MVAANPGVALHQRQPHIGPPGGEGKRDQAARQAAAKDRQIAFHPVGHAILLGEAVRQGHDPNGAAVWFLGKRRETADLFSTA